MSTAHPEKEISLLEVLRTRPDAGQRDLAEAVGMSLGMTNLLLKDLSAKGWMMVRRLSPRKVQYVLTPEGMRELSVRSYRFLKRTIRSVADCRAQLEKLVVQAKASGALGIHLVGQSEVAFVLEHHARILGLAFRTAAEPPPAGDWFVVYGENEPHRRPNLIEYLAPAEGLLVEAHKL